jgi:hypothetical protein
MTQVSSKLDFFERVVKIAMLPFFQLFARRLDPTTATLSNQIERLAVEPVRHSRINIKREKSGADVMIAIFFDFRQFSEKNLAFLK